MILDPKMADIVDQITEKFHRNNALYIRNAHLF